MSDPIPEVENNSARGRRISAPHQAAIDRKDREALIQIWTHRFGPDGLDEEPEEDACISEATMLPRLGHIPPLPPPPPTPSSLAIALQKLGLRSRPRSPSPEVPTAREDAQASKTRALAERKRLQRLGHIPHPVIVFQTDLLPTCHSKPDRVTIIAGNEKSPSGLRTFEASRPHLESIELQCPKALKRKTVFTLWRKPKWSKPIVLLDDDADAVAVILNIAHVQPRALPKTLTLCEVVNLALICQRYNLNVLLIGYLDKWIAPHRKKILEPGYEVWLFVAWQFGLEDDFLQLANHLAMNCTLNEKKQLLNPTTGRVIEGPGQYADIIGTSSGNALLSRKS